MLLWRNEGLGVATSTSCVALVAPKPVRASDRISHGFRSSISFREVVPPPWLFCSCFCSTKRSTPKHNTRASLAPHANPPLIALPNEPLFNVDRDKRDIGFRGVHDARSASAPQGFEHLVDVIQHAVDNLFEKCLRGEALSYD